jgi:hypothetical protein
LTSGSQIEWFVDFVYRTYYSFFIIQPLQIILGLENGTRARAFWETNHTKTDYVGASDGNYWIGYSTYSSEWEISVEIYPG